MTDTEWQKSSFSGNVENCVEVRTVGWAVELRESDEGHLTIRSTPTALAALLLGVKAGEFDHHA
ncbi:MULTISPECIES: DUF397 domain-containing protein [Streptomycetaceae]|uniref:DUF397 domain-containing protein n=1 Tax=Streptomycetaceae TaxID=2062 RepID=UPI0009399093|nr:DUF397 domain-containing protein [Streptomyces sp. CB02056]OKI11324.1 hypothetical protein AMK13_02615 [Streptomyces sp. CB02056]